VVLGPGDLELRIQGQPGFAVSRDGGEVVALDLMVDEPLRRRGLAREVIRQVQDLRKASGLDVSDRIVLTVAGLDELAEHFELIGREVLAVRVVPGVADGEGTPSNSTASTGRSPGSRRWKRRKRKPEPSGSGGCATADRAVADQLLERDAQALHLVLRQRAEQVAVEAFQVGDRRRFQRGVAGVGQYDVDAAAVRRAALPLDVASLAIRSTSRVTPPEVSRVWVASSVMVRRPPSLRRSLIKTSYQLSGRHWPPRARRRAPG